MCLSARCRRLGWVTQKAYGRGWPDRAGLLNWADRSRARWRAGDSEAAAARRSAACWARSRSVADREASGPARLAGAWTPTKAATLLRVWSFHRRPGISAWGEKGGAVIPYGVPQRESSPGGCCGTPWCGYPGRPGSCRSGFELRDGKTDSGEDAVSFHPRITTRAMPWTVTLRRRPEGSGPSQSSSGP